MIRTSSLLLVSIILLSASDAFSADKRAGCQPLIDANGDLTAVILHDIFAPPIASRIYAYSNIAAYEGIRYQDQSLSSLTPMLKDFDAMPKPESGKQYDFNLVGLRAFYATGKALVFSEADMEEAWEKTRDAVATFPLDDSITIRSIKLGEQISAAVIKRAKRDNYIQIRTYPRYRYRQTPGSWMPTPPDYAEGLEPYWNRVRPLSMDSAAQFAPERPILFDTSNASDFMHQVLEVFHANSADSSTQAIARYWDDNPFATVYQGHFTLAIKKVTPGGHWIGITSTALLASESDLPKAAEAFSKVSIALFDGFISCWDEKYRSNYIRPITAINAYVDERWKSYIQTPPFPEYTSGHSVISGASSTVLADLFGETFAFTDTLETINDLPTRHFNSFAEAASEASMSRFYGGIHFKPTLTVSLEQGRRIGAHINDRLRLRNKR
ncbi:MAG: vanadium-dependent haloperoxidase [Bacteroidota bacterium]